MVVPQYWAQFVAKDHVQGRRTAVHRFGWSNSSQEAALSHARQRAQEAMAQLQAGEKIARREYKVPYNGAEGLPIREEIVSQYDDVVITRNSYGALCLNTPNVLFADVDLSPHSLPGKAGFILNAVAVAVLVFWIQTRSWSWSVAAGLLMLVFSFPLWSLLEAGFRRLRPSPRVVALDRVRAFASSHPDWLIRVYETPAGFRLAVTHRLFEPGNSEVKTFFDAVHADPSYVRMCLRQQCFRARLTPKPWRVGMENHLKPRPGIWPIHPKHLPGRQRWVADYQAQSQSFAACRFLEQMGKGQAHPRAQEVMKIHDDGCRASTSLPLA